MAPGRLGAGAVTGGREFRGHGGERRGGDRDDFDPIIEGRHHGLAPEVARELWARVEREAGGATGRFDGEHARRRFHKVAEKIARNGAPLRPDVGKLTRVEVERYGLEVDDPFADIAPGKVTRVELVAGKRAAKGAAQAGRILELTEDAARRLGDQAKELARRAKKALKDAPEEARKALQDLLDTAQGTVEGLTRAKKAADTGTGVTHVTLDPGEIPRAIQRVRGRRAVEAARGAVGQLGTAAARKEGTKVVARLEKLAEKTGIADAVHAVATRIADGSPGFIDALDDALTTWGKKLDDDVLAAVLRRSADAVDPTRLLDDAGWVMGRKGIDQAARAALVRKAVVNDGLDLGWLRNSPSFPTRCWSSWRSIPARTGGRS